MFMLDAKGEMLRKLLLSLADKEPYNIFAIETGFIKRVSFQSFVVTSYGFILCCVFGIK